MTPGRIILAALLLVIGAFGLAPKLHALEADKRTPERSEPGTLQVQIAIPPPTRLLLEQDIQELFYDQIRDVFKQRGYGGKIEEVKLYEDPSPGCWLIKIDVSELRRDPIGNITITFSALLQTDHETRRNLGTFRGSALPGTSSPGVGGPNNTIETVAASALRDLYDAIAKTQLVPGIKAKA